MAARITDLGGGPDARGCNEGLIELKTDPEVCAYIGGPDIPVEADPMVVIDLDAS